MELFMTIVYVIGVIYGLFILIAVHQILLSLRALLQAKANNIRLNNSRLSEQPSLNLAQRVDATDKVLGIIDSLIEMEILTELRTISTLKVSYDLKNLDNDVKGIADKVFHAIKVDTYNDTNIVLNSEYLLEYITDQTVIQLLNHVLEYNALMG